MTKSNKVLPLRSQTTVSVAPYGLVTLSRRFQDKHNLLKYRYFDLEFDEKTKVLAINLTDDENSASRVVSRPGGDTGYLHLGKQIIGANPRVLPVDRTTPVDCKVKGTKLTMELKFD